MDRTDRAARLLAYAAALCGGSFACLLLFAGPAQADDSALPAPAGAVGAVGELAGEVTRSAGGAAGAVVEDVAEQTPVAREVVERAGEAVTSTTDTVATDVEQATDVAPPAEPTTPPAPDTPPAAVEPPEPEGSAPQSSATDPIGAAERHAGDERLPLSDRRAAPRQRAADVARDRPPEVPSPRDLGDLLDADPEGGNERPVGLALEDLLAPCEACVASTDAASTADSLNVQALPGEAWHSPPAAASAVARPAPEARAAPAGSPDVSPD